MPISIVSEATSEKQAEQQNGESFNPRRIAARHRTCCVKCGQPIPKGEIIERVAHPGGRKGYIWIHAACSESSNCEFGQSAQVAVSNDNVDGRIPDLIHLINVLRNDSAALRDELDAIKSAQPRQVEVRKWDGSSVKLSGCVNKSFDRVLQLASQRKHIFLPGPTGCGKTHLAEQVAEALGMDFSFISCSAGMSEGQLLGRLLPVEAGGKFAYVPAEFVERYEKGGVFLFDEIDAADSNVLLVINSALANGKLALPSRPKKPVAKRHPDFVCIAAANTWGKGADREYCGRNQLDSATLDRFLIGQVPVDYDPAVETDLCPHTELRERLWGYRERIREARLKRPMSTRFMRDAHDMLVGEGWTFEQIDEAYFSGWREDEVAKVRG